MARILSKQLAVGAQWETLIGLQKEPAEIRGLAKSRDASFYAVSDDGVGTRTAGLFSMPAAANVEGVFEPYALAAILGELVDAPNVAFLHPDPEDPEATLFITLRDHRPEADLTVPTSHLRAGLDQWLSEVEGPVKLVGIAPLCCPVVDVTLTLDEIAAHVRKEQPLDARLKVVRKPLPARQMKIAAVSVAAISLLFAAGWWGWSWYDDAQQAKLAAANRVDPVDAYKQALTRAIAAEPFSAGASHARRIQYAIQSLPAMAGGWRPVAIDCDVSRCEIQWRRQEGGTFDLLLSQRPNAQIIDLDHAREIMTPADTTAPAPKRVALTPVANTSDSPESVDDAEEDADDGDARVTPVPRTQFLRSAGARLQSLGDYGMDISLSMPSPLVIAPPGVAARRDVPPPIAKGEWKMAGHLAFMDSVAGLMMRAGNMSLRELKVVIDDNKPVFSAQGTYYVH